MNVPNHRYKFREPGTQRWIRDPNYVRVRLCATCKKGPSETPFNKSQLSICRACYKEQRRATSGKSTWGTIYFVQLMLECLGTCEEGFSSFVKIGHTKDFDQRAPIGVTKGAERAHYFTDNPYPLRVLALAEGHRWEETELHSYLVRSSGHRGEWYWPTSTVLDVASRSNGKPIRGILDELRMRYPR